VLSRIEKKLVCLAGGLGLESGLEGERMSKTVVSVVGEPDDNSGEPLPVSASEPAQDGSGLPVGETGPLSGGIREVSFQMDLFGNWTFLSTAWTLVTGFDVKPSLGTFFLEYLHEEERESNRQIFARLVDQRLDYCRYETRLLTHNGKVRWVEVYIQRVLASDGSVLGAAGCLTDITSGKMPETEIEKLAAFPQVNPNPVLEFGADGTLTYANAAAQELAKALGQAEIMAVLPSNAADLARGCLASGKRHLREEVHVKGRTLTWSFFPIAASKVVHCYGADVTEVRNLEAQFRHAQKLESVGQLAAGVAHDFNNLLTVIQGYAECLLARSQNDATASAGLKQIVDASQRAASLTRQLLMFSRKQVIQMRVTDLNLALKNLTNLISRMLGEKIRLETTLADALPQIESDAGMLEQVVMNLVVNARDAMPNGGTLTVSTSCVEIGETYASQRPDAMPGRFVCLTVADSGCGMDRRTLERIFEPFFSTKEVGKGTGLGLATAYGIIQQHRGWIEVSSQVGAGTAFKIFFPALAPAAVAAPAFADGPELLKGGRETILVVEDEPVLRELVCVILRQHRYQVLEAASGVEAMRVWEKARGKVDLLLTDIVMPEGMSGRELAVQLRKRKPELRVIYTSGYSPESLEMDFGRHGAAFLSKPYLPPQMVQLVRQCLDTPIKASL
jgi:PAS domain S-box-containing protein